MLHVTRYDDPQAVGWAGYIEPDDKSWIAFIGLDGRPVLFLEREPSGAVVPPSPRETTVTWNALTVTALTRSEIGAELAALVKKGKK